jgi:hypothetical protein
MRRKQRWNKRQIESATQVVGRDFADLKRGDILRADTGLSNGLLSVVSLPWFGPNGRMAGCLSWSHEAKIAEVDL